ncbi:hypothetical protein OHB12_35380 [Nocardia sp. NBC_01730]|uniref:hypothetical protein n=1 Tax=Nocardia sp. NBC_01730 TaxID=2975998 RepID=UPI002E10654F|nr:hypothetical protein OHB12_35380 [Nocardia sp. NBC_01730]
MASERGSARALRGEKGRWRRGRRTGPDHQPGTVVIPRTGLLVRTERQQQRDERLGDTVADLAETSADNPTRSAMFSRPTSDRSLRA